MPASRDKAVSGPARRRSREALDRWLAEADDLLSGEGQVAGPAALTAT